MAISAFKPEVWNANLLVTLEKSHVYAAPGVVNRDYEGDIANYGDTVHITSLADPTIGTYTPHTDITIEDVDDSDATLLIDQAKYFAFEVDDVDARQTRDGGQLLTKAAMRSASKLADTADSFLATLMTTNAGNVLSAQDAGTPDAAYLLVRKLMVELDKDNVPQEGRFLIVSPDFYALILGDNRFVDASRYGSTQPIRNGEVGSILGFSVLRSNNLPAGTAGTPPEVSNFVIAGSPIATTFAEQINKTEAYRPESAFSDAIKGLHLYGARVVRPEALAVCDVDVTIT